MGFRRLLQPMAIGVIGGLAVGLVLVFLFLPPLYLLAARRPPRDAGLTPATGPGQV